MGVQVSDRTTAPLAQIRLSQSTLCGAVRIAVDQVPRSHRVRGTKMSRDTVLVGRIGAAAAGRQTRVRIFYQTDPAGPVLGGIDSFIRGLISASPPDIRFSVVGVTTDPIRRPVGR